MTEWRCQSVANPSLRSEFSANREKYREIRESGLSGADSRPKFARTLGRLDGNSLRTGTGNFRSPNRELIREIREFEAENTEWRRAARWHPFRALHKWGESSMSAGGVGRHSEITAI